MGHRSKAERKQQILTSAIQVFAQKGMDKASMDDIVAASGLSKGTLYWHFENKEALSAELIKFVFDQLIEGFQQAVTATADVSPPERLRALLTQTAAVQEPSMMSLYMDFFAQAWQKPRIREALREAYSRYVELVSDVIHEGIVQGSFRDVDSEKTARSIAAAVDGVMAQYLLDIPDWNVSETLNSLAELILHGLSKPS